MYQFFIKGLLRDRQRSLLPIIVVTIGVMLAVLMHTWITGVLGDMIDFNSRFTTGHVKIMSRAYNENRGQNPNDLALMGTGELIDTLNREYPEMTWVERINFGGLVDAPDEQGNTKEQGPATGMAIDLLSPGSKEAERLNLRKSMIRGDIPSAPDEIVLSEEFAGKLKVGPGDQVTLISSTMYGAMSITNFTVSGTIRFGVNALARGGIVADINGIRRALDMQNAAGEILGYLPGSEYDNEEAVSLTSTFNRQFSDPGERFSPVMVPLSDQNNLGSMITMMDGVQAIIVTIFIIAMSIVLWNAGLLGGLRRYGEVGLRMAIGESKGHVYRSLLNESVIIGLAGSVTGTLVGLLFASFLENGIDISSMMESSSMMMSGVVRARITPPAYYIGFIPGLFATILGTALAGIGIYKRQTATLFKELQA